MMADIHPLSATYQIATTPLSGRRLGAVAGGLSSHLENSISDSALSAICGIDRSSMSSQAASLAQWLLLFGRQARPVRLLDDTAVAALFFPFQKQLCAQSFCDGVDLTCRLEFDRVLRTFDPTAGQHIGFDHYDSTDLTYGLTQADAALVRAVPASGRPPPELAIRIDIRADLAARTVCGRGQL